MRLMPHYLRCKAVFTTDKKTAGTSTEGLTTASSSIIRRDAPCHLIGTGGPGNRDMGKRQDQLSGRAHGVLGPLRAGCLGGLAMHGQASGRRPISLSGKPI